jgi:hypothetical protein
VAKNDALDATSWSEFQYYDERSMNFAIGAGVGYLLTAGLLIPGIVLLTRSRSMGRQESAPPSHHFDMSFFLSPTGVVVGGKF